MLGAFQCSGDPATARDQGGHSSPPEEVGVLRRSSLVKTGPGKDYSERIRAAQLQARYEQRLKSKALPAEPFGTCLVFGDKPFECCGSQHGQLQDQEVRYLQERLNRQEDETAKMQAK